MISINARTRLSLLGILFLTGGSLTAQEPGTVKAQTKISSGLSGFTGALEFGDSFGISVSVLGDLDGDGVQDLAVGAQGDDGDDRDLNDDYGGVWILQLNNDGTVKNQTLINAAEGGLGARLEPQDWFGYSVEGLGDIDGDGTYDLAIGAGGDDDGGNGRGAVYLTGLNSDGSVANQQKISSSSGGFGGQLINQDAFGFSAARLGDLNQDGFDDLVVGHVFNDDGGFDSGGLFSIFLDGTGQVLNQREIANGKGGFGGTLDPIDELGRSVSLIGDLDGDGVVDLASGAFGDSDGAPTAGSLWILFMKPDGTVRDEQKISATSGGFDGALDFGSRFGSAVAPVGDLDADGVLDLVVGASRGPLFYLGPSRLFVLFMNRDGTVKDQREIGQGLSGFTGPIEDGDRFGTSVHSLGDLDGDGVTDIAVGANGDDEGGFDHGAVYILFLNGKQTFQWRSVLPGTAGTGGIPGLSGDGLAQAGTPTEVHLFDALPNSFAHVFLGFTSVNIFFKGGWLYTLPEVLFFNLPIDGQGQLDIPFLWPVGIPVGMEIHLQTWVTDPGGLSGFAATNGLIVTAD